MNFVYIEKVGSYGIYDYDLTFYANC